MRVGEEKNERDDFSSNIVIAKNIVHVFSDSQIHLMENAAKCKINRISQSDEAKSCGITHA